MAINPKASLAALSAAFLLSACDAPQPTSTGGASEQTHTHGHSHGYEHHTHTHGPGHHAGEGVVIKPSDALRTGVAVWDTCRRLRVC